MWMLIWVGLGGAVGAMARYSLGLLFAGQTFPWGTLTINVAGSFFIGALWSFCGEQNWFISWGRGFLLVGVLGGFTTFSAFSLETLLLINNGRIAVATTYVMASVGLCLLSVWLGSRIG
jgi:CrcB protein